jgi:plasmid stability protein
VFRGTPDGSFAAIARCVLRQSLRGEYALNKSHLAVIRMTPFELSLGHELDIERQRFGNKWLFKWYCLNMEGRTVDVPSFDGSTRRRVHVGSFGQPRLPKTLSRQLHV